MKALRLPICASAVAYCFASAAHALLLVSCPPQRSRKAGGSCQARAFCFAGRPSFRLPTHGRQWDLSGLQAILPVPLLRSSTPVEPMCPRHVGHIDAAPATHTAKASAIADFGAHSRSFSTHSPTLRVSCSLPAGWLAFAGWESNPLDRYERFQFVRRSSSFPVLLTLMGFASLNPSYDLVKESGWPNEIPGKEPPAPAFQLCETSGTSHAASFWQISRT
jgi:hypothetical protein